MKTIEDIRQGFIQHAKKLKRKSKKESDKLKAKDMNGIAKGFLSAANELKNYLDKRTDNSLELDTDCDITPEEIYMKGQRFRRIL